jgi:hypothetical protein
MKSNLLLLIATSFVVSPLPMTAQTPVLINSFTNPNPVSASTGYPYSWFGCAIATLGSDRVLVGARSIATTPTATNIGAVYLFHTNGTLLTTFTNPHPVSASVGYPYSWFGSAIATLGSDCVLIGSPQHERVYLFTTNGALVSTISAPPGLDDNGSFGATIAAFGNDQVLIGAPEANWDNDYYTSYGAAYLYSTNGALLQTFDNPSPGTVSGLGAAVAAFGSDRVLIGASDYTPGAAYLFRTNGTLLMTFTNPAPSGWDYFGQSAVAVGTDRVLVGAVDIGSATTNAGAAYLFNTNGVLLLTITNPTPALDDRFGFPVAMLGNDRVIIGARYDDTTGPNAGSAYVFSVNGNLLATINNPTPATDDYFGWSLAAFGSEGVIIGAPFDNTGATNAGSAYLFSTPSQLIAPSLTIQLTSSNTVAVSWPSPSAGFALQQNTNGVSSANWSSITAGIQDDGTIKSMTVSTSPGSSFYRLFKP